jgi:hypothetical protein
MKSCVSAFACCVNQKKRRRERREKKLKIALAALCDFGCARRGVTRRAHTHRNHHPHHRRARDDAMRVRYNNSHARESGEKEREKAIQNLEMIIGYGRTILPSLSLVFSRIFPSRTKSKKQIFLFPRLYITQKALGKRSLAPVAVVRLLLGGEDSRTRGERARFRVHGKGRHISTRVRVRKVTRDCVCLSGIYFFLFFCVMCV